jgi:hypothetical protein
VDGVRVLVSGVPSVSLTSDRPGEAELIGIYVAVFGVLLLLALVAYGLYYAKSRAKVVPTPIKVTLRPDTASIRVSTILKTFEFVGVSLWVGMCCATERERKRERERVCVCVCV